jgi:hypothetical protein
LLLLVGLSVLPALVWAAYSGLEQRHVAAVESQANALRIARLAAGDPERRIADARTAATLGIGAFDFMAGMAYTFKRKPICDAHFQAHLGRTQMSLRQPSILAQISACANLHAPDTGILLFRGCARWGCGHTGSERIHKHEKLTEGE